jgi:hypothetical protein
VGLIRRIAERIRRRFARPHFRRTALVESVGAVPEILPGDTIVLVGSERQKWAVFDCPCGAGHRVTLNLQPSHYPVWRASRRGHRLTIWPSVDVRDARRCHYFITNGFVRWVSFDLPPGP